jgi:1-aminocyclopropane-1-carboxylate deaminase/D-cysteine desulfhydrase-like pyridoxal-dependent ACC family enzyme
VLTRSVPRDGDAYERSGNVALDLLYGARVHLCDDQVSTAVTYERVVREAEAAGRTVATLPIGGSNGVGVLGYLAAAVELRDQLGSEAADRIICPVGSCGTVAGLALGTALLDWPVVIDAVAVSPPVEDKPAEIRRLANEAAGLLREAPPGLDHVRVTGRAVGPGYGIPTEEVWEAIRLFGRTEGITLDPVYTGKAAAALVDAVRGGEIGAGETVVFLHTGGLPGLFGYAPELFEAATRP